MYVPVYLYKCEQISNLQIEADIEKLNPSESCLACAKKVSCISYTYQ